MAGPIQVTHQTRGGHRTKLRKEAKPLQHINGNWSKSLHDQRPAAQVGLLLLEGLSSEKRTELRAISLTSGSQRRRWRRLRQQDNNDDDAWGPNNEAYYYRVVGSLSWSWKRGKEWDGETSWSRWSSCEKLAPEGASWWYGWFMGAKLRGTWTWKRY